MAKCTRGKMVEVSNDYWFGYEDGLEDGRYDAERQMNKYKWHDLRKDPRDLPTRNALCLTIDEFNNLNLGYLSSYSTDNTWNGYRYLGIRQPIAWKEIEPFEEAE